MLNIRGVMWLTSLAAASPLVACAPAYMTVPAAYPVAYPAGATHEISPSLHGADVR
jgi:hypothetical protein